MDLIIQRIEEICKKIWENYPTNNIKFEHFVLSILLDKSSNCLDDLLLKETTPKGFFLNVNNLINGSLGVEVTDDMIDEITLSLFHESNIVYKTRPKITLHSDFKTLLKITFENNKKENKNFITISDLIISFLNISLVDGPSLLSLKTMFISKNITSSKILNFINDVSNNIKTEVNTNVINEVKTTHKKNKFKNLINVNNYTENLNLLAYDNKINKTIGRENELNRLTILLGKKNKNNVLIIGDCGVGKTNLIHGLAHNINNDETPFYLTNKTILNFNHSSIIAGTQFRGMLEEKLNKMFNEIIKAKNIILFIDDLSKLYSTNSSGQTEMIDSFSDAVNREDIQIIATCDYQKIKTLEKNISFLNKFEKLYLNEVTNEESIKILLGNKSYYENYHNVSFSNDIIELINTLSKKYITDKKLPESSLDVLDEIGSMFRSDNIKKEITEDNVLTVISNITNIPINKIGGDDKKVLKDIDIKLKSHIIGQDDAIKTISQTIKRNRLGVNRKSKPSTFLCIGSTGVGKTFLAKKIAEEIFGSENKLIRFDMSEYSEKNSISKLIGTSPGYIGFEKGGLLTEAVKHNKYCVLLFDEIEKSDPEVYNLFLQLFDDGILTDGNGYRVDFKNTIIILTSNIGSSKTNMSVGFIDNSESLLNKEVEKFFTPEFLNRIDEIIYFNKLGDNEMRRIIEINLSNLKKSLYYNLHINLEYGEDIIKHIHTLTIKQKKYGARPISRVITNEIENLISDYILDNENIDFIKLILHENEIIII